MNKINNNDIRLEVEKHEYKLSKQPEFIFTSVTTIINSFFEPFDEVKISTHLANNVPKYFVPNIGATIPLVAGTVDSHKKPKLAPNIKALILLAGKNMNKITSFVLAFTFCVTSLLANEVNVFSARHYDSDIQLYEKFTSKTGIKVNIISGKDKALQKRIIEEGADSKADL